MPGPLAGVRVLDLSRILAGPWAGQLLADLGADVVKVERPGAGDDTRGWGPPFLTNEAGDKGDAGYFLAVNRGKRSVTVNLDSPQGQQIVRDLAAESDVLLENYKVGTLARYGLGPDQLRAVNPRLVYCSVTGFGQTGPRRDQAAYDFMIQAMGGLMSVTGERDGLPGGGPQKVGVPIVDILTGMYTAVSVLAALCRRNTTGAGDYVDIAMLDVQISVLANQAMNYLVSGREPTRNGNAHPNIQPQDVYACKDGSMAIAVGNDGQFAKLCKVLGRPELSVDDRFATNAARVRHLAELRPILADRLLEKDRSEWVAALDLAGVPAGPINTVAEALVDPQVTHRGMRTTLSHPFAGSVPQIACPIRYADAVSDTARHPPTLGEHTDEVLRGLHLTDEQIQGLRALGVI